MEQLLSLHYIALVACELDEYKSFTHNSCRCNCTEQDKIDIQLGSHVIHAQEQLLLS